MRRALSSVILLVAISCGSLFFRLGSLPLSGADEPRYARIAQEMHDQGNWVTPSLQGKPWLEKPPLYYWLTIPFYSLAIDETTSRLGPALCALITGLAVFWIGPSRTAGFIAAAILLTSLGFIGFGRSASTDMPFTCFFTLSMTMLASWDHRRPAGPGSAGVSPAAGWMILLAWIFLGIAVVAKGPVALALAAGILLFVWFLDDRGVVLRSWHVVPGVILTAVVSIPWFWLAFRENGFSFIATFFINHNLARYITDIHHHSQPFYYYLPVLVALLFPWSGWLVSLADKSIWKDFRNWREWNPLAVFLACWFLFPIIFFSLSDSKLAGYILPSLPPLALILGILISRAIEQKSRLRAVAMTQLILSAAMAVAAPITFQKEYGGNWKVGLILSAAIALPAVFSFIFGLRGRWAHAFGATVLQGVLIVVVLAQFAFPVLGAYHSTKEMAYRTLQLRHSGEPIVTYRFFHHSLHYYTDYQVAGKLDDAGSLLEFARTNPEFLVVTNVKGMKEISAIKQLSVALLAEQGNFRLLRIQTQIAQKPFVDSAQSVAADYLNVYPIVNLKSGLSKAPIFISPNNPSWCSTPSSTLRPPPVSKSSFPLS